MTSLRIEICRMGWNAKWRLRIGDIEGAIESSNITIEEALEEIKNQLEELDRETPK